MWIKIVIIFSFTISTVAIIRWLWLLFQKHIEDKKRELLGCPISFIIMGFVFVLPVCMFSTGSKIFDLINETEKLKRTDAVLLKDSLFSVECELMEYKNFTRSIGVDDSIVRLLNNSEDISYEDFDLEVQKEMCFMVLKQQSEIIEQLTKLIENITGEKTKTHKRDRNKKIDWFSSDSVLSGTTPGAGGLY